MIQFSHFCEKAPDDPNVLAQHEAAGWECDACVKDAAIGRLHAGVAPLRESVHA